MRELIIVRGGGDLATGTIHKLHRCGYRILVLENEKPTAIRRKVSFSEAIYESNFIVEEVEACLVKSHEEIEISWEQNKIPIVVDSNGKYIDEFEAVAVVDGILAKKNLGTNINMAPIVIGLGPGFIAGEDVHAVVETKRGHDLGRIIFEGRAIENTGVPGSIMGYSNQRVIHSPSKGIIRNCKEIGDLVNEGEVIAVVSGLEVKATLTGVLRGILRDCTEVWKGMKIADIDPRLSEKKNCYSISDKARCIAGGVLEAILYLKG